MLGTYMLLVLMNLDQKSKTRAIAILSRDNNFGESTKSAHREINLTQCSAIWESS